MKDVLIIMGSENDLPVMKEAAVVLDRLNITYTLTVVSAHRTPKRMYDHASNARSEGYKCIIAGAGGAAHLPGMTASISELPVIGVPIRTASLSGMDSLYSIVQMPPGIPVATMAIDGARNAGIFAAKIVAASRPELWEEIIKLTKLLEEQVLGIALDLESKGYQKFLDKK